MIESPVAEGAREDLLYRCRRVLRLGRREETVGAIAGPVGAGSRVLGLRDFWDWTMH